jgi:hypothetical protein
MEKRIIAFLVLGFVLLAVGMGFISYQAPSYHGKDYNQSINIGPVIPPSYPYQTLGYSLLVAGIVFVIVFVGLVLFVPEKRKAS